MSYEKKKSQLMFHIKRWNEWRKTNKNGVLHKILVLLKLRNSSTFDCTLIPEDIGSIPFNIDLGEGKDKFVWITGRIVNGKIHYDGLLEEETLYKEIAKWQKNHPLHKTINTQLDEEVLDKDE